jgi:hypothetical protein
MLLTLGMLFPPENAASLGMLLPLGMLSPPEHSSSPGMLLSLDNGHAVSPFACGFPVHSAPPWACCAPREFLGHDALPWACCVTLKILLYLACCPHGMLLPLGMKLPLGHAALLCMLLSHGHAAKTVGHYFVTLGFSLWDVSLHLALNFVTLFQTYLRFSSICLKKYIFCSKIPFFTTQKGFISISVPFQQF